MTTVTARMEPNWLALIESMWRGATIQEACAEQNYRYLDALWFLNTGEYIDIKRLLLDTSMLAAAREEILDACPANH